MVGTTGYSATFRMVHGRGRVTPRSRAESRVQLVTDRMASKRPRVDEARTGYPEVTRPKPRGEGLPGLTRSRNEPDHAVITPESRVWCGLPGWDPRCSGAYLASPQMNGALFTMCLVKMPDGACSGPALPGVERFILVVEGGIAAAITEKALRLSAVESGDDVRGEYLYLPPDMASVVSMKAEGATTILMFEQVYRPSPYLKPELKPSSDKPRMHFGFIDDKPTLDPGAPEVFTLRKLLPLEEAFDFNIHVMDFEPGQFLHCNEMHYNQHGMLMLEGQGIYRLGQGDGRWYHLRAGDAVYMAPYCPQWYAALEPGRTRYILYKDTYRDPLLTGSAGAGYKHNVKYQAGI